MAIMKRKLKDMEAREEKEGKNKRCAVSSRIPSPLDPGAIVVRRRK